MRNRQLWHFSDATASVAIFVVLMGMSIWMARDALVNGPTWFQDYTLYGMQYGAQQVFEETVLPALEKDPSLSFVVSPSWANGAEQFTSFFLPTQLQSRVTLGQPSDLITNIGSIPPKTVIVATNDEYNKLLVDQAYKNINVLKTIDYPNGQPGFYELTLQAADNIKQIMDAQHALNRNPIEERITWNGQTVRVLHSPLGSGQVGDMFDNDPDTLARVLEANPFVVDIFPTVPFSTKSIFIKTGSMHNYTVTIRLYAQGAAEPVVYSQNYLDLPNKDLPPDPEITIPFDRGPAVSERVDIEIMDNTSGDTSQIHIRTIQFK